MARIKDLTVDSIITGTEMLVATDADLSTKNIPITSLQQYLTIQSPIAWTLPTSIGTPGQYLKAPLTGTTLEWATLVGTPPAGSNTQLQFNDDGAFGASVDLTWDGTDLTVNGGLVVNDVTVDTDLTITGNTIQNTNDEGVQIAGHKPVLRVTDPVRNMVSTDIDHFIYASSATDFDYILDYALQAAMPAGAEIDIIAVGSGTIKVTPSGSGETINGGSGAVSLQQYRISKLKKVNVDTWILG